MSFSKQERYQDYPALVARAVMLRQLGYVVLVLVHSRVTGYSAFRPKDIQKRDGLPEDSRILILNGDPPAGSDLFSDVYLPS
ncbi:MAG: hypothetical protein BWY99_02538 [Synergistetes bacterium ADurb.BinA166]|nr:MAG: hypothetical protein BWY99_02538 [Synergistetes bacterium ADurb.BinA166]